MIKIISDSTCDLPEEIIQKYGVVILPLHIHLGEREYKDGLNISPEEIFEWCKDNGTTPKTSAIALDDTINIFRQYAEEGYELICFTISEYMSTSGNVMRIAADELGIASKVHVINSQNLCAGIGLLIVEAAEMIKMGKATREIVDEIQFLKSKVRSSFIVDSLTYLYMGGRCSSIEAMAGSMLKIHPKIVVEDGKMHAGKKYRGKLSSAIMSYMYDMEEELREANRDRIYIAWAGCDDAYVKMVREYVEELNVFDEITVTKAGGVISSHCGPGTLGIFFIAKNE